MDTFNRRTDFFYLYGGWSFIKNNLKNLKEKTMNKSIFYTSLFLVAGNLSPAIAMNDGEEEATSHRTFIIQGSLNAGGDLTLNVDGNMRIGRGVKITSRGSLSITGTGAFENLGGNLEEIVAPNLTLIGTDVLVNHGTINFSPPQ